MCTFATNAAGTSQLIFIAVVLTSDSYLAQLDMFALAVRLIFQEQQNGIT